MFSVKTIVITSFGLLVAFSALAREVVIDVRTTQEFQAGHIDGALNIPHGDIAQDIFKAKVNKDDHVVLYCRSGNRSGIALKTLQGLGFTTAENYGSLEEAKKRLQKP